MVSIALPLCLVYACYTIASKCNVMYARAVSLKYMLIFSYILCSSYVVDLYPIGSYNCSSYEFKCQSEEEEEEEEDTCISSDLVCDGEEDCSDGSDEYNCSYVLIPMVLMTIVQ